MGIKGLLKLVEGKQVTLDENKIIGIDALPILIESLTTGVILNDSNGNVTTHINTLTQKIDKLPYKQIWVFDNIKKNPAKEFVLKKRAFNQDVFKQISLSQAIKDLKTILDLMNIKWIVSSPEIEAEHTLVEMYKRGYIDYIYSKDSDVLAYGGNLLIYQKSKFTLFEIKDCLKQLNISMDQFVYLCCLLETDFSPSVKGITYENVMKRIGTPLENKQKIDYIIFKRRIVLDPIVIQERKVDKKLIEFLYSHDIVKAGNRLKDKYNIDI